VPLELSGSTVNPFVEQSQSSLLGGGSSGDAPPRALSPPNFITDCFFLVHILISFMTKKSEQFYMKNNEEINKSITAKDYQRFDEMMAIKLCYDAHLFGKNTLALYRQLFSFTHCLVICLGDHVQLAPTLFNDLFSFLDKGVQPCEDANDPRPLALDFQALP
jgi:hypothetical protein